MLYGIVKLKVRLKAHLLRKHLNASYCNQFESVEKKIVIIDIPIGFNDSQSLELLK